MAILLDNKFYNHIRRIKNKIPDILVFISSNSIQWFQSYDKIHFSQFHVLLPYKNTCRPSFHCYATFISIGLSNGGRASAFSEIA